MNETKAEKKTRKRQEAEARNAAYQALPLADKLSRNSLRVTRKLGVPA